MWKSENMQVKRVSRRLVVVILWLIISSGGWAQVRPKVGLVLSGGGAKGLAEIATLKILEELGIPVDFIAGTSMGGIVGGLHAVGYSGWDLENLALTTDWNETLTDTPPRTYKPYFEKEQDGKYQLEFGFENRQIWMPRGLIQGRKVSLLFSSLIFPFGEVMDFDDLPIPFRCVAVDLLTGREIVLKRGSLAKAIRATMAIPSVFTPVEWGDYLLIDGGYANNLPVDIVREMGADIIIAVDVGRPMMEKSKIKSALDVLQQSIAMLGLEKWRENSQKADIVIRPDLSGYSAVDFYDPVRLRRILEIGEVAAEEAKPKLIALRDRLRLQGREIIKSESDDIQGMRISRVQVTCPDADVPEEIKTRILDAIPAEYDLSRIQKGLAEIKNEFKLVNISFDVINTGRQSVKLNICISEPQPYVIARIEINGNQKLSTKFISRLLGIKPGEMLNTEDLNHKVMEMYGLGYFEEIEYEIRSIENSSILLSFLIKELPERKIKVGIRYDDEHKLVAMLGSNLTNIPLNGLRVESGFQFAGLNRWDLKVYYPSRTMNLPIYPFLDLSYKDIRRNLYGGDGERIARFNDRSGSVGLGVGLLFARWLNSEISYEQEFMNLRPDVTLSDTRLFPQWKDRFKKINAEFTVDTLDDKLIPENGLWLRAEYEGTISGLKSDIDYNRKSVTADFYTTFSRRHTLRFYGYWGNGSRRLPIYKYHNQGNPLNFVGMHYHQLFGNRLSLIRCDYRFALKSYLHIKVMANITLDFECRLPEGTYRPDNLKGAGIGIMFASPFGPLEIIFSRGNKSFTEPGKGQSMITFTAGTRF